ncbi:hypothetical protein D1871_19750 [Nakamurella silvestris]|nr:hypothetical protein D1871_19750 [Nakamurella silvestris]
MRLIAVDGPSGSGKTTVAHQLAAALGGLRPGGDCEVFATDHLATWENPVGWWPELEEGVLAPLAAGRPARIRVNDWTSGVPVPGEYYEFPVPQVLIIEGVSAARLALGDRLTAALWVELPGTAARLERSVARDGENSRRYLEQWQRDEERWFAADGTRARWNLPT